MKIKIQILKVRRGKDTIIKERSFPHRHEALYWLERMPAQPRPYHFRSKKAIIQASHEILTEISKKPFGTGEVFKLG